MVNTKYEIVQSKVHATNIVYLYIKCILKESDVIWVKFLYHLYKIDKNKNKYW